MNQPTPPSGDRVNFPKAIGAAAQERQTQYRERRDGDYANQPPEALINLVQDLTQQNHQLRDRVAQLEAMQPAQLNGAAPNSPDGPDAELAGAAAESSGGQVAYLLNQLEFAQQANQRQAIRIDSLAQQSNTDRLQLRQLEQDNSAFQNRCRTQAHRISELTQRCEELQQRLQRQQRYTLQLKAALDRCLEVPPPSYTVPDAAAAIAGSAATDGIGDPGLEGITPEPQTRPATVPAAGPDTVPVTPADAATPLASGLLPKPSNISPWSQNRHGNGQSAPPPGETIAPLKPAPQVPQMSHFKMTLFNLAHQPPTEPSDSGSIPRVPVDASPLSSVESGVESSAEPKSVPGTASKPVASIESLAVTRPGRAEISPRLATPPTIASAEAAVAPGSGSQPAVNDTFWADLVQMVAELPADQQSSDQDPDPGPVEGDRPNSGRATPMTDSAPETQTKSLRKPDRRAPSSSEGVDTLLDVVLQGAKAIASQLRPSEDPNSLPQSNATSGDSSPALNPASIADAQDETETSLPAVDSSDLPPVQPAPNLGEVRGKRSRIDLPTFLRPQPQ